MRSKMESTSPLFILCEICREAYFLTRDTLLRHQQVCLAVKSFILTSQPTTAAVIARPSAASTVTPSPPIATAATPITEASDPSTSGAVRKADGKRRRTESPARPTTKTTGRPSKKRKHDADADNDAAGPSTAITKDAAAAVADGEASNEVVPKMQWQLKKGLSSARDYSIANPNMFYKDTHTFLAAAQPLVEKLLRNELQTTNSLKYNIVAEAFFIHPEGTSEEFNFKVPSKTLYGGADNLKELLQEDTQRILAEQDDFEAKGSGWSLDYPSKVVLRVSRFTFNKLKGKAFTKKLPTSIKNRKSTINIENQDDACFKYSILVKHLPGVHCDSKLTENDFIDIEDRYYDFDGLTFPVAVPDINKFEQRNPNVSVNVFEVGGEGEITPLRVVNEKEDHTDLLLYRDGSGSSHYVYIIDFARLIRPQIARGSNKITVCKRCVAYRESRQCVPNPETWLKEHLRLCVANSPTQIRMPKEGENILKFNDYDQEIRVPIIVCADFEATLLPIVGSDGRYQSHEPNSFCTLVKTTLPADILREADISTEPYVYRLPDAGRHFMRHMSDLARKVEELYLRNESLGEMTKEEKERHAQATQCDFCERLFDDGTCVKMLDHDHITSKYRHTLCGKCNLKCEQPNFIPVYLHNLSNYDANFILKNLGTMSGSEVNVIPATNEKYISISVKVGRMWLRFLDSYRLMASGLAKLASILSDDEFCESSKLVPPEYVDLVKRKNVYPYDYVKSADVFNDTCLPPRESFYNRLNDEHCSEEDYEFAKSVWNKLNMKTFAEYHDFYLKLDVCLLADCLTSFRKSCLDAYRIDCCHHYTAPGFAYSAMLRMTRVSLELITCSEQMLMVENGVRGGLVQCSLRYAKANNRHLSNPVDYKPDEPTSYLLYLDAINLYGSAMLRHLPVGNFKFIDDPDTVEWSNLPEDSPHGYILDCDIECPDAHHDKLQDLPPLPSLDLSPTGDGKTKKLLATLTTKRRYVVHYTALQQAQRLGLKVLKVHRVLSFSQSAFMKRFVELNARLRAETDNAFYKGVYKLITNSVYGRTCLNKRKQREVRIVTTDKALQKLVRQPRFAEHVIISPNVVAVHMRKRCVKLNVPIYVGMTVLEHSKTHMYNFFYNTLCRELKTSDCNFDLCYIDTDGIILYIRTEKELYEILKRPSFACQLDQSTYPADHPLKDDTNKGVLGTFKDEATRGRMLHSFVGLRSKMYAYSYGSQIKDFEEKEVEAAAATSSSEYVVKAKGIKTGWVKSHLRFEDYKRTLFDEEFVPQKAEFNLIRSKQFNLVSTTVVKKSLSANDDKRHIMDCGLKTLPHGHWRLREQVAVVATAESDSENEEDAVAKEDTEEDSGEDVKHNGC